MKWAVRFETSRNVIAHHKHVGSGIDGKYHGVLDGIMVDNALHIHIVGHHYPVKAQFIAEHALDNVLRQRSRQILVELTVEDMRRHYHVHLVGLHHLAERFKFLSFPGVGHVGQTVVGIGSGTAVSGEMLHGTKHSMCMVRINKPSGIVGHHLSIQRETAVEFADNRAILVDIHIEQRSEINIQSHFSHFAGNTFTIHIGSVAIIHFAQIFGADRRLKTILLLQAAYASAFLVHGNQQIVIGITAKVGSEFRKLFFRSNVSGTDSGRASQVHIKKNNAPDAQVAHIAHSIAVCINTVALEAHHQHLGGITPQGFIGKFSDFLCTRSAEHHRHSHHCKKNVFFHISFKRLITCDTQRQHLPPHSSSHRKINDNCRICNGQQSGTT